MLVTFPGTSAGHAVREGFFSSCVGSFLWTFVVVASTKGAIKIGAAHLESTGADIGSPVTRIHHRTPRVDRKNPSGAEGEIARRSSTGDPSDNIASTKGVIEMNAAQVEGTDVE